MNKKRHNLNQSISTGLKMSKKKHKFRVMTNKEYYNKYNNCINYPFNKCYSWCDECDNDSKPCQLPNGKYILIEVKE